MERRNLSNKRLNLGLCVLGALCLFWGGCERHLSGEEPPLRPLVYTELPPEEDNVEELVSVPMINIAPEDLGYTLFHAIVDHDREAYESMFIRAEDLAELVHMALKDAKKTSESYMAQSEVLWTLFSSKTSYEEPVSGLSSRLRLSEFRLGKGRNLAGKIASPETDEVVQHWGNELRVELLNSDKSFTIRVPKIVKTRFGWRIAQPIDVDKSLRAFLETGMHLKTDLLRSEHYPMPLEVGNFWKYRIEKGDDGSWHGLTKKTSETQKKENHAANTNSEEKIKPQSVSTDSTVTDMIIDIVHREGYWIVTFERTWNQEGDSGKEPESKVYSWLVTPRMVFPCLRDCRNQVDSIGYLLGYIMRQTPIFVFPTEVGSRWDVGGSRSNRYSRYEVRQYHQDPVVVPDGAYIGVYEIFGSIEEGRETRFFMPGTGIVMRIVRSGAGIKRESLIQHRLIL